MSTPHTIAVLGLGRMGGAIATRLAAQGRDVVGWTRSGRTADTVKTTDDPDEAVARADLVVLALFDGAACRQVLDRVHGSLRADTIVLNTSTIAPAEAAELARRLGPAYVHAPLLGSVPAAAAGALEILAAADRGTLGRVRPVLETLGTVRPLGDAATAAALKLIANNSLTGAVLALRDSLRQADALGLPRDQVLDVLELGQLGGLVARKRPFLLGEPVAATTQFTIGALAKDMALLAAASDLPLHSATGLALTAAGAEADVAVAATVPAVEEAVLEPLRAYVRGHATGDPAHFRGAFLPTARIEGIRDGAFVSWHLDEYCALFPGRPAPDEEARTRRIDSADVHGTVATATMTLAHGADTFTDVFLLIRADSGWRIANKAYHRHLRPWEPGTTAVDGRHDSRCHHRSGGGKRSHRGGEEP
ncbi:nuclear transport factor 2 family protein [Streptomyces tsukubensis]|uniref:6-phosphogluconate dehydrogenase n=1 Tax=Streptomyces tsukubensis (strain DSM 42081 / NBRC 108919 / NRRL 18488 / 9993) TaxID=1114943 RepID=A0A7G3UFX4_STRT9|nr:nuclear transport factor 2 family protein [Streptomyces tsukubensis]AZK94543.1 6-phosphogluconate dehydrogenase [Streptomyces tsukubensis]QKM69367.1 6-phosphogluconate dehydrogenase [Streptomyces tsukubensis NRRL18488]TAI42699.1 6-phosphogluconate dehydrogenase [Streptomyces tsukubensis]